MGQWRSRGGRGGSRGSKGFHIACVSLKRRPNQIWSGEAGGLGWIGVDWGGGRLGVGWGVDWVGGRLGGAGARGPILASAGSPACSGRGWRRCPPSEQVEALQQQHGVAQAQADYHDRSPCGTPPAPHCQHRDTTKVAASLASEGPGSTQAWGGVMSAGGMGVGWWVVCWGRSVRVRCRVSRVPRTPKQPISAPTGRRASRTRVD